MDVKKILIDDIGLSNRAKNRLHKLKVHQVSDMLAFTEEILKKVPGLGEKTVNEILQKIEEYRKLDEVGGLPDKVPLSTVTMDSERFDQWPLNWECRQLIAEWLQGKAAKIDELELLSAKAYNILLFAGIEYLHQIVLLSEEELLKVNRMDDDSAKEILKQITRYVNARKEEILSYYDGRLTAEDDEKITIYKAYQKPEYRDLILQYVKANDVRIEYTLLSVRPKNRLLNKGYKNLSDIIFLTRDDFMKLPAMGSGSVDEVIKLINDYLNEHEDRILAVLAGDTEAILDDELIREMILLLYKDEEFRGLNLKDITGQLDLPSEISQNRLKSVIGKLLAEKKLEYVDYRCYRVFDRFADEAEKSEAIDERSREFILRRLQGETLETIANDFGLTRERVRQVVQKSIRKIIDQYRLRTGTAVFDEDYYQYLYETYDFDKKDGSRWLGIPDYVWNYFEMRDIKRGKNNLASALDDAQGLDIGLRLKIKNYLNRNNIFVDGIWVEKKRADLEQLAVRKFCTETVTFNEFTEIYNKFLENEDIPYDENIYYTDTIERTRKNRLKDARFLLWKQGELLRYYDIDGRDYTELLETLNLDAYENTEFSTVKLMRDYPEVMERYDLRDQYELHNLLKKIIPDGSYNDFHCDRNPMIRFGSFDRDAAILDIIIDHAPISNKDLANLINEEYGYDPAVIMSTYLQPFSDYYHQGAYRIDQKQMLSENRRLLQDALTEDFYFIDEIRRIYTRIIPDADPEEVNSYNLKQMGFLVLSKYVLQNHPSLEEYFLDLLTGEDIIDISAYRKRYTYVAAFSSILQQLKRELQVIEFEPNRLLHIRKLEQSGITKDLLHDFCDDVYSFVEDKAYFSAQSLKQDGFESELYDLGFSDWFYANLLLSDPRFSYSTMFGNLIFYKGKEDISIKSFERSRIIEYGVIDTYDLLTEMTEKYGCVISDKMDLAYKVRDTEIYYDSFLDRFYANKEMYYREMEGEY